jgi:phage terminase large subunit-like protein
VIDLQNLNERELLLVDVSELSLEEMEIYLGLLSPKARATVTKRYQARTEKSRRVWFCGNRQCDGRPHGPYDYPHARGSKEDDERGSQYPPTGTDWVTWLNMAGRGSGKTATGSHYTRSVAKHIGNMALVGPTGAGLRNVMIEGPSGLIKACEAAGEYVPGMYEPSKQRFTFANGAVATLFTAEEPERIRGGNFGFFWGDEPAFWQDAQNVWNMLMFALRIGVRPHALATTTPLPSDFMKGLIAKRTTQVRRGSTYDNRHNLSPVVFQAILDEFEGTYLGRQEIYGEIIDDRQGALWSSTQFQHQDFYFDPSIVQMDRVLVGIDPAGSQGKRSDLTGIIVGGIRGEVLHALADYSGKFSPAAWAQAAIRAYEKYSADAIVVERNYGGDMCRATLKAEGFDGRIIEARATDGKRLRAEPVSAKYEQHKARHARGAVPALESEMVSWVPGEGKSPNRVDAWVWVATALTKSRGKATVSGAANRQSIGPASYVGPGSRAAKKDARRSTWLSR